MIDMKIEVLNDKERGEHHYVYRKDKLFVQWENTFRGNYEERYTKIDAMSLWKHSTKVLLELRHTTQDRGEMIMYLIDEMRRANSNKYQVEAVIAIVCTQLANASVKGHTREPHPNDEICVPILKYYYKPGSFFKSLIDTLSKNKTDALGRPIELIPHDPMTEDITLDSLPQTTQESIEAKVQKVLERTKGLKSYFNKEWDNWEKLWLQILMDEEFYSLIDAINPRGNKWGMNLKMVANVMGMFKNTREIDVSANKLNACLDGSDRNSYISRCQDYSNRTHCALNEAQGNRILKMIKTL